MLHCSHTLQLRLAEEKASDAEHRMNDAVRLQHTAQAEAAAQTSLARDHLEKYQREVVQHATVLQALTDLRSQTDALRKQVRFMLPTQVSFLCVCAYIYIYIYIYMYVCICVCVCVCVCMCISAHHSAPL
jgi:hypothetical protein